jgi:hypothetical protein
MSYDHAPRWTQNIILPSKYQIRCPECGHIDPNADELLEVLKGHTAYKAQHIPPAIIGTCDNIECERCDEDFAVPLKVAVSILDMPEDIPRCHWIISGNHAWVMVVCQGLESVFRAALFFGLALDNFHEIRQASPEEISMYKRSGCEPLLYGGQT